MFCISDTQKKLNNIYAHYGVVEKGSISIGDKVNLKIENDHRQMVNVIILQHTYFMRL